MVRKLASVYAPLLRKEINWKSFGTTCQPDLPIWKWRQRGSGSISVVCSCEPRLTFNSKFLNFLKLRAYYWIIKREKEGRSPSARRDMCSCACSSAGS
ncbi:hypothetical protein Y1Q_0016571 [Alligator mississippiensis]|uniref:Uncharacterized protein n=1 Tax=Alligator mississippiensis TaxID=8496 RepID=A0A151N346_ALLMI|nr:hypothetical protein Y1Q_0016571 [Alligator mississippiensis]